MVLSIGGNGTDGNGGLRGSTVITNRNNPKLVPSTVKSIGNGKSSSYNGKSGKSTGKSTSRGRSK